MKNHCHILAVPALVHCFRKFLLSLLVLVLEPVHLLQVLVLVLMLLVLMH
jgi:hypothetical protein